MEDAPELQPIDVVTQRLRDGAHESVSASFRAYQRAEPKRRKELLRSVRSVADDHPAVLAPHVHELVPFLTDETRSVRLNAAKLFVTLSRADPDAVIDDVDALTSRLADEEEFYYVRARSAEALGYVGADYPEDVATPDLLANLVIGLSFDEPKVKEKLAKALAYIALGDPGRLRHRIADLAEHLDAEEELVRYHLCTALVAVGSEYPAALSDAVDALSARLEDECPHVRGRAAEALGLVARTAPNASPVADERLTTLAEESDEPFVTERARFAAAAEENTTTGTDEIGSLESIHGRTDEIVDEITSPDHECPHCGAAVPEGGPPLCPHCGGPY
ncbi:HEAT repeat domain-containing protein [Haloterrigena sp. SYSU A121-1]|uniref:HEAT repeat domain-containing protein n=1 Tax=Haloterrigena gelatinilytica TaxID=2741724 RepID=A0A8J8GP38_9EURY|nr:HEAT repeat domain-containing protein [Haloterrigena gelatinilytica]NUB93664.1 HEAT repeat domain-containing protein [Haloterrigena gelatinilytica]